MSLGHVYIVLEPVGSARLTLDEDMYYELCVFDDRSLFGVLDEIKDVTRSLKIGMAMGRVWAGTTSFYPNPYP